MKKTIALVMALALACSASVGTMAAEDLDTENPIKIAYSGPMTGDYAEYGILFQNAVELAVEQTNEAGGVLGRKVEVVEYDDKNSSEEAGSIAEKIVEDDDIVAVFGHFASGVAMTAAQVYQEEGYILMSASASHVDYSSIGDYIFRNNVTQDTEAYNCLQIAIRNGCKKIGVLKLKTDWGESAETSFLAAWDEIKDKVDGVELVDTEEFVDGTTDYSSNITKFEEAGCDCIVVLGMYGSLGPFAKQYRMQNTDALLISVGASYTNELINLAGDSAEGIQFPAGMNPDSDDPKIKAFVDAYTEYSGGKTPENMSGQTYENVLMLFEAIEEAGTTDREAVKDMLYEITYEGVTGTISFDEIGDAVKTQTWYIVEDGKFVEYSEDLMLWDDFVASL